MKKNFLMLLVLAMAQVQGAQNPSATARAADTNQLPSFSELYNVIRANATNLSEPELQRAAVVGLLHQLSNQVTLLPPGPAAETNLAPLIAKSERLNNDFAYLRIGQVKEGLPDAFRQAFDLLKVGKKLDGLVVDLRFASGHDYHAAGRVADQFLSHQRVLFRRGETVVRSTEKTNAITLPIALLINNETSGAAEVLAAILHDNKVGLLIGSSPKKHARSYKDVPLPTGQLLRIATSEVAVGNDTEPAEKAAEPDLPIAVKPELEKLYFDNPYAVVPVAGSIAATNAFASTNLFPRHRINEAELVRMQREGLSIDAETVAREKPAEQKPVITDPALARALDILKGLAMVQNHP